MSRIPHNNARSRRRAARRPSIGTLIRQAEKAGQTVTSITTPDGVTLRFGEQRTEASNPWLADLARSTKQ